MYVKNILKNDKSISNERINILIFSLKIFDKSLTGKKPPDEINENAKFSESNVLIEMRFKITKIKRVIPE